MEVEVIDECAIGAQKVRRQGGGVGKWGGL